MNSPVNEKVGWWCCLRPLHMEGDRLGRLDHFSISLLRFYAGPGVEDFSLNDTVGFADFCGWVVENNIAVALCAERECKSFFFFLATSTRASNWSGEDGTEIVLCCASFLLMNTFMQSWYRIHLINSIFPHHDPHSNHTANTANMATGIEDILTREVSSACKLPNDKSTPELPHAILLEP